MPADAVPVLVDARDERACGRSSPGAKKPAAAVTIEYVATTGSRTIRTISGLDLDPPYLHAWCHLRDAERVFTLSRIHGVMPPA